MALVKKILCQLYLSHIFYPDRFLSHQVMFVVEPQAVILGSNNVYLNEESVLNLTCVVTTSPKPSPHSHTSHTTTTPTTPQHLFWYHNNQVRPTIR